MKIWKKLFEVDNKTFKFFSFNKSLCEKIWCCIFLSFVFKNMLLKVDFHCRLNFTKFTHLHLSGFTCVNKIQDNK